MALTPVWEPANATQDVDGTVTTKNNSPETDVQTPAPDAKEMHRLVAARLEKAEKLRDRGMDPYANDFRPELTCDEFRVQYEDTA